MVTGNINWHSVAGFLKTPDLCIALRTQILIQEAGLQRRWAVPLHALIRVRHIAFTEADGGSCPGGVVVAQGLAPRFSGSREL